jgi:hypothetical protein
VTKCRLGSDYHIYPHTAEHLAVLLKPFMEHWHFKSFYRWVGVGHGWCWLMSFEVCAQSARRNDDKKSTDMLVAAGKGANIVAACLELVDAMRGAEKSYAETLEKEAGGGGKP